MNFQQLLEVPHPHARNDFPTERHGGIPHELRETLSQHSSTKERDLIEAEILYPAQSVIRDLVEFLHDVLHDVAQLPGADARDLLQEAVEVAVEDLLRPSGALALLQNRLHVLQEAPQTRKFAAGLLLRPKGKLIMNDTWRKHCDERNQKQFRNSLNAFNKGSKKDEQDRFKGGGGKDKNKKATGGGSGDGRGYRGSSRDSERGRRDSERARSREGNRDGDRQASPGRRPGGRHA